MQLIGLLVSRLFFVRRRQFLVKEFRLIRQGKIIPILPISEAIMIPTMHLGQIYAVVLERII